MKYKKLGKTDLDISAVGLGCMGFTHGYGFPMDKKDVIGKVHEAYDIGYRLFDTAELYFGRKADGTPEYNEEAIGEAFKGRRDKVTIASKFGIFYEPDGARVIDSTPERIRKSIDGSLKRLGTDYIDLYYQHRIDPRIEPEVVAEVVSEFIKAGKVRAWGISEVGEDYLRRAHAVCPVSAVQNMYSMIDRDTESLFPVLEELGITFVAFTPLAKGFLSGKYKERPTFDHPEDNRGGRYQFSEEGFNHYQSALALIASMAEKKNATSAQIALAWIMSKKPWIVPIPGTRSVERMQENADASEITLTAEESKALTDALDAMNLTNTSATYKL